MTNNPKEPAGKNLNGITELDPEQLSAVSGGVITDSQKGLLNNVLKAAKIAGYTLDAVLALVPSYYDQLHSQYPNVTLDEVTTYIKNNYASL